MQDLNTLAQQARDAINAAADSRALEDLRVEYLGKKGQITALLKGLGKLSAEERPQAGATINVVKQELQELIGSRKTSMEAAAVAEQLSSERIDVSMDGRGRALDNIFVERLWRTVKYENIYMNDYRTATELQDGLKRYFDFYNQDRIHQSLGYQTPFEVYSS